MTISLNKGTQWNVCSERRAEMAARLSLTIFEITSECSKQ